MNRSVLLMIALVPLVFAGKMLTAETPPGSADQPYHAFAATFVGVDKCKTCHRKPEDGNAHGIWQDSRHSKAYATLGTPEARAVAEKAGVADPQNDPKCLKCHVTGYLTPGAAFDEKFDRAEGVGCEACHGAGSEYRKKSTMEDITRGTIDAASVGLNSRPDHTTCEQCHNPESPTFKSFDYETMQAKINHPIPEAKKAEYR